MARQLIALLFLTASCFADDSGYAAPQATYQAAAPTGYGAPDPAYGAPDTGYGQPEYAQPSSGYGVVEDAGGDFDLSKITELLPLFLAVFAAIIVANLFAPLLGMLFGAKVGLLGGLFAPLSAAKLALINAILLPLGLELEAIDATGGVANKRNLNGGWSLNEDTQDMITNFIYNAAKSYGS